MSNKLVKPVWKVSWLKYGKKCVQYGSPGWATAARGQMHGWGVLRKTTGSLTSISTQWDTRHAWHTHVKDRSAFEPQGIWKLCVVVHTVQAGIYTIYPYLQPYSDLNYNSVNRLRVPHILRLTTKGRSDWCATCVNTRMINMAAGLKYFELWASGVTGTCLCMECAAQQYEEKRTTEWTRLFPGVSMGGHRLEEDGHMKEITQRRVQWNIMSQNEPTQWARSIVVISI